MSSSPPRRWPRRLLLLLLLLVVVGEVGARLTAGLQRRVGLDVRPTRVLLAEQTAGIRARLADTADIIVLDSLLGWTNRRGLHRGEHDLNAAGVRATREHAPTPAPGRVRVAAFGDAYVYGAEVPTAQSWGALVERTAPEFELLNFGVGGYGTDQALLRYLRDGAPFAPQVVIIGFSPVSVPRGMSRYTRFASTDEAPLTKPRFVRDGDGALVLLPNPLPTRADWERLADAPWTVRALGEGDAWYAPLRYANPLHDRSALVRTVVAGWLRVWRRALSPERLTGFDGSLRPDTEAFALQRAVLTAFADSVRARGARPLILLLPDHDAVSGMGGYRALAESLGAGAGLEVLDMAPRFTARIAVAGEAGLFAPGGHFGPEGNRIVAEAVTERLRAMARRAVP